MTRAEREEMPHDDTVWPVALGELESQLGRVGLDVRVVRDCTPSHHRVATALCEAYGRHRDAIGAEAGERAAADLVDAHRVWARWLGTRRIRKLAVVARKL